MKIIDWNNFKKFFHWSNPFGSELNEHLARFRMMERNIGLPAKAITLVILFIFLFLSGEVEVRDLPFPHQFAFKNVQRFFLFYTAINIAVGSLLIGMNQLGFKWIRWSIFSISFLDGIFLSALLVILGGSESILFWFFPVLLIRNAASFADGKMQLVLNILISLCYLLGGFVEAQLVEMQFEKMDEMTLKNMPSLPDVSMESIILRWLLLTLISVCLYGIQVLLDKRQHAEAESHEFALRQEQLHASGRLAGEIAHQLKNPLSIINNAAYNLQRYTPDAKAAITQQIRIIREEVERSDRIITDLMGYARLAEGRLERLNVVEVLDHAIAEVYPQGQFETRIYRDYTPVVLPLMMQRNHLSEVFMNLVQNAREAMEGHGELFLTVSIGDNYSIIIRIRDTGPGIPPEIREKVYEPYFTTKEKGTGLGLAIVRHNTEIYSGTVEVKSELGKGTEFILTFPARSLMLMKK